MRIMDYENNRSLNDVGVFLTIDEAEELLLSLGRLKDKPAIRRVFLTQVSETRLEREITVSLTSEESTVCQLQVNAA